MIDDTYMKKAVKMYYKISEKIAELENDVINISANLKALRLEIEDIFIENPDDNNTYNNILNDYTLD